MAYLLGLVLAAWPPEIRPAALDGASELASETLARVGIRAGIPVFTGSPEKQPSIIRARCIVVTGTDSQGRRTHIHPLEPCPRSGFLWKPVIYDHMIFHWSTQLDGSPDSPILWAMGDHFCQQSRDPDVRAVEITKVLTLLDYETGRQWRRSQPLGRVTCRGREGAPESGDGTG